MKVFRLISIILLANLLTPVLSAKTKFYKLPAIDSMFLVNHSDEKPEAQISFVWNSRSIPGHLHFLSSLDYDDLSASDFDYTTNFIGSFKKIYHKSIGDNHFMIIDGISRKYIFSYNANKNLAMTKYKLIEFSKYLDKFPRIELVKEDNKKRFIFAAIGKKSSIPFSHAIENDNVYVHFNHNKELLYGTRIRDKVVIELEKEIEYLRNLMEQIIHLYVENNLPKTEKLLEMSDDLLDQAKIFKKRTRKLKYDLILPSCCISNNLYDGDQRTLCGFDRYDVFEMLDGAAGACRPRPKQ